MTLKNAQHLPVGGCDHAVSATTCQALLVLTFAGFRGAALNQSRSASGVYTGLTSEMPREGQDMFCITATFDGDKTHGTRCVLEYRRHAADTPKHLGQAWPRHPNAVTPERSEELSGCFDVREGQRQGGLTGGCAHCVITTTLPRVGVVTAHQGFAGAANAPLTGFHSKGRSHWSLASPSALEHGDSALYITVNVNQRFAYECCIAFAGVVTLPNLMGLAHRRRRCRQLGFLLPHFWPQGSLTNA